MATTVNNNNIETKNGMSQVVIDLRPQVKHQNGHGREVLADVHFRIDVQAYVKNFYTYTEQAREESEKACEAYYSEVVEMLKAEGWTLRKEKYGVGDCPELVKGTQYLYCHPQDISGEVNPADIEGLEARIKALTSCKYYKTDNYGDIIVTTSESDEKQLYRDTYADGLAAIWKEVTTTKRSNLYKDKAEAEHCVRRRICIANRRADLNDIGTGCYNMRTPLLQFLMEEYDRLLKAGYIKEATGQNGRTLCRWINKKEEKELNKARREAEKTTKETEGITEAEGIKIGDKVCHNKHEEVATVTAIREAFVNGCDGYRYLYTLDFGQSVKGPFDVELNGGEFLREAFTLQEAPEIKPKAAFQIGDRVERKSDGERGTVDDYGVTDGKLTYIVKYDRTQRRQSDGFEYMSEELYGDELQTDAIESRKRTIIARAKQDKQAWVYYKGYEVRVRKAYTNDSHDPKDWTYCVSWYADEQLVECENGVRLEQAAEALNDLPRWAETHKAA